jgi:spore cortex formation protein SpoVR/YcgB (stage V sporulation)
MYTQTKVLRGVLVIKVHVLGQALYLMELQRRPPKPRNGGREEGSKPPSYKGLVFTLDHQNSFEDWLRQVLSNVRHAEGVVQK